MVARSVFGAAFAYRPTPGRTPQEDYFTELLAAVLNRCSPLAVALVRHLCGHEVERVHVETQKVVDAGSKRIDLWFDARDASGRRHVIVMENKIDAGESPDQLMGYRDYLSSTHAAVASRTLIYATLHKRRVSLTDSPEVAFRQTQWFEMADWIRSWARATGVDGDQRSNVLVSELILLMEDWGMAMEIDAGQLEVVPLFWTGR